MSVLYLAPKTFTSTIKALAQAYSLDLDAERSYLSLEKDMAQTPDSDLLRLIIEKLNHNTLRVSLYDQDERLPSKAIAFFVELLDGEEHWTPLEIVQGFQSRQVASPDEDGCITQFDSQGTQEVSRLCQHWAEELKQQKWHLNGKPLPGITATSRYFCDEEVPQLPQTEPWLQMESDYCIQGSRSGLLALIEAAASALALQNEASAEVFDAHCDSHYLKVTLCHSHAQD